MKNLLKEIDRKREKFKFSLSNMEREPFLKDFAVHYAYDSSAIEGNHLTLEETFQVFNGCKVKDKPLKDHLEILGHKEAFEFILELVKNEYSLSQNVIKSIHGKLLIDRPRDRGLYRSVPVKITGALHEPVQPYLIEPKMEQLLHNYQNSKGHFINKLSRFHLDFERIHPFIDGNGRTGRLLLNFELMKAGFKPVNILYEDKFTYFDALKQYEETGSTEAMVNFFGGYVLESFG